MFNETITSSSETASKLLALKPSHYQISGAGIDYSFVNTFGLIIGPRKPEEKFLVESGPYHDLNEEDQTVDVERVCRNLGTIAKEKLQEGNTSILYIAYGYTDGYRYNEKVPFYTNEQENPIMTDEHLSFIEDDDDEMKAIFNKEDWTELSDLNAYFSSCFPCRIIINEKLNISLVFLHLLSSKTMHTIQSCISRQFPGHFKEKPIDKTTTSFEYKYVNALTKSNSSSYHSAAAKLFKHLGLNEDYNNLMLTHLFRKMSDTKREVFANEIQEKERQIDEYYNTIYQMNEAIYDMKLKIKGLEAGEDEDEVFLKDYLKSNTDIEYVNNNDRQITFDIENYVTTWIEETAEASIRNRNNGMWCYVRNHTLDEMQKLMRAIFIDRKYRIKMKHRFEFDTISAATQMYELSFTNDDCYLHNPHLTHHSCLGGYREPISKSLREGNILNTLEYAKSAVGSVNLDEAISAKYLVKELDGTSAAVLEKADGNWITVDEALREIEQ